MRIALLGGTGDIGEGLALRWAFHTDHEVIIGSRDPEKARAKADEYETELSSRGRDVKVNGFTNEMAADRASVVVLAVPPYHVSDTVEAVSDSLSEGDVLVTPAAGIKRDDDGFHYHPPKAGSVTALVADAAPDDIPVVGAFHNLSAGRLADLDADLGIDTLLVADDPDAKETVRLLADGIDGLRPLDAGGLANASEIEALTPLLINVAQNNEGMHDLGIEFK
ncbi:NADPH-dependent F420 reductase [Haloferax elongans ATCC BAA-1513]|uniref:NADPH-dependent F420 reductase n=1 Tax=Haloferax elongans ATCC BAA-1513 TaxID=1230453 RepID=M0HUZ5_HALEO|nr:NADPH-dependent F420 reductase [Haloferax elongans]ELZ87558.1 NADPH-dependent F420 reductase [Haloferax elongans ATCC BAA-1513]